MAVISGDQYRALAVSIANARDKTLATKSDIFDAVYSIVFLKSLAPEVDLLNVFWGAYLVNSDLASNTSNLTAMVRAMNAHVVSRSGLATVDLFLEAHATTVPQTFADLSNSVGYPITHIG